MSESDGIAFRRYLDAKRTVDERALNGRVHDRLQRALDEHASPLEVLEVGAGIGATVDRALSWPGLPPEVRYTAVEMDSTLVDAMYERLPDRIRAAGYEPGRRDGRLVAERDDRRVVIEPVAADAFEFTEETDRTWDLIVGQAFLDLTDVRQAIDTLGSAVRSDGLFYFPITFDGGTIFEPTTDPDLEARIERRFHRHMDTRTKAGGHTGDSAAGRHTITAIRERGDTLLAAGGSDWVVHPTAQGYPHDEAAFLRYIVSTVEDALRGDDGIDPDRLATWAATRREQIDAGRLVYIAHQLDVLARRD